MTDAALPTYTQTTDRGTRARASGLRKLAFSARNNLWLLRQCRDYRTYAAMRDLDRTPDAAGPTAGLIPLRFRFHDRPLLVDPAGTEWGLIWCIFERQGYRYPPGWRFSTVLDLGANVGLFLAYCQQQARRSGVPLTRYVAVEPDPKTFAHFERQVESLGLSGVVQGFNVAASDADGVVRFDDTGGSCFHQVSPDGRIEVPARSVDSVLDEAGLATVDLLKIDIEGGEREVIPTVTRWGHRVGHIFAELHYTMDFDWFAGHVRKAGFVPFKQGKVFGKLIGAVREDLAPDR